MITFERVREAELMDDPDIAEESHIEALDDLANVNRLSRVSRRLWRPIYKLYQDQKERPLRVLDLATGSGDNPIALCNLAKQKGANIKFDGCDLSERCVNYARQCADKQSADVSFFKLNVVNESLPDGYDVIMTSQFMHHIDPPEIIALLSKMRASSTKLLIVNDLLRSYVGLAMVFLGTRLLSDSNVIHFDGPASIRAAFTILEWRQMAQEAGITDYQIRTCFPCHMMLTAPTDIHC